VGRVTRPIVVRLTAEAGVAFVVSVPALPPSM
jgi:hypothetical protein